MIGLLLSLITALAKSVFFFFIVPYILYYRVYDYFKS